MNKPILNSVIVAVLVIASSSSFAWLTPVPRCAGCAASSSRGRRAAARDRIDQPAGAAAAMVGDRQDHFRLSPHGHTGAGSSTASPPVSTSGAEAPRAYLIGPADLPRLARTFWACWKPSAPSPTISGPAGEQRPTPSRCSASSRKHRRRSRHGDGVRCLAFGLSGSLVLGSPSCRQPGPGRFHIELEECWPATTRLSEQASSRGDQACQATYVEAPAERHRRRLDELTRTLRRAEKAASQGRGQRHPVERLASLAEAMRGQQTCSRMAEQSIELRGAINRMAERARRRPRSAVEHQRASSPISPRLVEENVRNPHRACRRAGAASQALARTIARRAASAARPAKASPMAAISHRRGGSPDYTGPDMSMRSPRF